jgi:hypothetical protein
MPSSVRNGTIESLLIRRSICSAESARSRAKAVRSTAWAGTANKRVKDFTGSLIASAARWACLSGVRRFLAGDEDQ